MTDNPRTIEEVDADRRASLSRNVQRLMDERRMSYTDLSRATGLSRTGLFKIADGKSDPQASTLFAIADFFGLTIAELYDETPRSSPPATPPEGR